MADYKLSYTGDQTNDAIGNALKAVLTEAQNLTEAQQKQARQNIALDIVTVEDQEVADFTDLVAEYGLTGGMALDAKGATQTGTGYVTGYIPIQKGDIIRIKDPNAVAYNVAYAIYDADKTIGDNVIGRYVNDIINGTAYGAMIVSGDTLTWDTSTISYWF